MVYSRDEWSVPQVVAPFFMVCSAAVYCMEGYWKGESRFCYPIWTILLRFIVPHFRSHSPFIIIFLQYFWPSVNFVNMGTIGHHAENIPMIRGCLSLERRPYKTAYTVYEHVYLYLCWFVSPPIPLAIYLLVFCNHSNTFETGPLPISS